MGAPHSALIPAALMIGPPFFNLGHVKSAEPLWRLLLAWCDLRRDLAQEFMSAADIPEPTRMTPLQTWAAGRKVMEYPGRP
jgi:hypothetical protein